MAARFHIADAENGQFRDDPDHDGLFAMISSLNQSDNTFVTVNPADDSLAWYGSVSFLSSGSYEVELADPDHHEHQVTIHADLSTATKTISRWLATHQHPR